MRRSRTSERLKTKDIDALPPGEHQDGGGLVLRVEATGAKRWVQRLTINGRRLKRGLGGCPPVSLKVARRRSKEAQLAAWEGRDILSETAGATFAEVFEEHFAERKKGLKNGKHIWQWEAGMKTHAYPVIGERPIAQVTHDEIVAILRPIWMETPVAAKRLLQRMRIIFDIAISRGIREKANPCIGVADDLPKQGTRVRHQPALPYVKVPGFIRDLRAFSATYVTKLAFEWQVLTATRPGETRFANWAEINTEAQEWVIPAERMKAKVQHVVPLAPRCLEILAQTQPGGLLFPAKSGEPLSNMAFMQVLRRMGLGDRASAHGFRSSFRDWATEVAKVREVVAEAALAHTVPNKTEAAYRRATYLEARITLMADWASFCVGWDNLYPQVT
jgi:integrase